MERPASSSSSSSSPRTSALPRVLEPEGMETPEEVEAYDAMAHGGVNGRFVADFLATGASLGRVLDLGTGTALIPLELARVAPRSHVVAIDLSAEMLGVARRHIERAGLADRIEVLLGDAKRTPLPARSASAVMSNSLVHHLPDPLPFFEDARRLLAPGAVLFVRDLFRPFDDDAVAALVRTHAADDSPPQRALFEASRRAALTLDEIRACAHAAGLGDASIETTSDRHWTLSYRAPTDHEGVGR
jgi:ubiquinone/menaquinone biosynthesis C-methylase UbiE